LLNLHYIFNKGPVTQRKRMNHARITHIFSFLRRACVVCVIRRWIERGPSLIVSWYASKAVSAWFWVSNGSKNYVRYSWVGVRSLCVEYASLCAGHESAVSAYASELVQNRARPRPSTDAPPSYHARTAHVSRAFVDMRGTKVHVRGTFAKRACLDALRQWFMRRACVKCSWNTTPYLLVCVDVRDMSVIPCAVHAWFVSVFCPRNLNKLVNFLTYKHAQTQSVRDMWAIRVWSALWLALKARSHSDLRLNHGKKPSKSGLPWSRQCCSSWCRV